jgi:thiol-disulfide isomerase/thioredoxin
LSNNPGKLCIVACVMAVAFFAASCSRDAEKVAVGGKNLDFTLNNLQGNEVTLSGLRGKVVVVEFWATWCPPCRESVPELNELYEKYRGKDFELLGISVDKGGNAPSLVREFVKERDVLYPVLLDDKNVNSSFGVGSIPVMFVIDKEGKVVKKHTGFVPGLAKTLSKDIEGLL